MICVNTYVIASVVHVYSPHCCSDHVLPCILTTCHAWPMTCPLQIVMIMHELKHEPKTSVRCASCYPSCDHDMRIDKALGGVNSAGRKVREQFI